MPEVSFEETWVEAEDVLMEPGVDCGFSVVSAERVAALLWPEVHHLADGHCEGVGEGSSEVGSEECAESDQRSDWHVGGSPKYGDLIDHEVVAEEGSEWTDDVLHVEWESALEEIVRSLFEGDSFKGVKPALVSLLQFLREGLISIVSSASHIQQNSSRRCDDSCSEDGS